MGMGMDYNLMGIGELSKFIGARRISFSHDYGFSSTAIDSRKVKEGCLFFALEGSVCDGHDFVIEAFNCGASAAVVESSKLESHNLVNIAEKAGKDLIIVENTLKGLQDSARVYLDKFPNMLKIGITGSSGKTTTKEITAAIISNEKNTVKNKGNLNSETGLPLSVFEVRSFHETGIFELGMNKRGEISSTASVLKPDIALVTNIGTAHIEYFGTKTEILKEKKSIFNFMTDNGIALIPINDDCAYELAKGVKGTVRFFGAEIFPEFEQSNSLGLDGTEIYWAGQKIRFALPGKHSLQDAMAAIAIAKEIPVSNDAIKKGLESVKPLFGRLEILKGRTTVVCDCYNANPESTAKSVEFCDSVDWQGKKVYVIGDMLELGETSATAHAQIGDLLSESKADKIFLFGSEVTAAASRMKIKNKPFFHTGDFHELSKKIGNYVQTGDLILLKGSRGCTLERLVEMLTEEIK
jgi:UDP-N-acetylmuramoyl-tripeptide--D-alanyl-D-alanine ligase